MAMQLAHAIRKNKASLADAHTTYKQNVVNVNTVMNSVLTSQLPTLNQNPPDWADFTQAYARANADALQWANTVLGRLLDVPQDVRSYNSLITQLLQDAKSQAEKLKADPNNGTALTALNQDLDGLSGQLNLVVTFITGAVQAVSDFKNVLPKMASELQTISDKSAKDAKVDQAKINELRDAIKQLQNDIKQLTAAIVALGIADAAAITLGTIATIAAWPVGAVVWLFAGPVIAVATTIIALDAVKIKDDNAKIEAKQKQITGLTADVSTLQILSDNYSKLAEDTSELEDSLQAILNQWQTLESEVNAAINDIRTAISDTKVPNFDAVLNDINDAIKEWNDAYNQAGTLYLDLKVNTADLQIGMTQDQVKTATGNARTMGVIEYYNNVDQLRRAA